MKTELPQQITSVDEAKSFLSQLIDNNEVFHPEDNAHDVIWNRNNKPTHEEKNQLNKLTNDIYSLDEVYEKFCPCEYILSRINLPHQN